MSYSQGGRNSVQRNFVKKFEHILSRNPQEKIKNPLFQYSHGFRSPIPGGPIRSEVRSLKTINFPNFRRTRKKGRKGKRTNSKKLILIKKRRKVRRRRTTKIGGRKPKKGGRKAKTAGRRKSKTCGGKKKKRGGKVQKRGGRKRKSKTINKKKILAQIRKAISKL